ncbi:MAG: hypothetical protein HUU18_05225 [Phycisphaerales bacterium]|nr:hypothetical protein [Phycisphaerales bacterium]
MSHNLRQRIQRLEHVLHGPASKEEVQRQLAVALTAGTPPTDREAQRRYDAAREAFAVLGGDAGSRFFSQKGEAIGRLFVVVSEEEMEGHRRDVHEQGVQAGEIWPHPWPEGWERNSTYLNTGTEFPPRTKLLIENNRERRSIDATDVEKYRSKGYRVIGREAAPTERDLLGRIVRHD